MFGVAVYGFGEWGAALCVEGPRGDYVAPAMELTPDEWNGRREERGERERERRERDAFCPNTLIVQVAVLALLVYPW